MKRRGLARGRCGATLAEVVVALGILAIGITISLRLLQSARIGMDDTEIELRAMQLLRELSDRSVPVRIERELRGRAVVGKRTSGGGVQVRYLGGEGGSGPDGVRTWTLEPPP